MAKKGEFKNNIFYILGVVGIFYWSVTSRKNRITKAIKRGLERRRLLNKK